MLAIILAQKLYNKFLYKSSQTNLTAVERTWINYKDEVLKVSSETEIAPEYLLALIALECSGVKEIPSRFESHVFLKLQDVRSGVIPNFESITTHDIEGSSDDALKNLASSWGPFQLMGYQCFYLDIKLKELRGSKAIYYGTQWIDKAYGKYLSKKRYKDAFHLHNTGKPYPKFGRPRTHNLHYVPKGIKLMKEFKTMLNNEAPTLDSTH